MDSCNQKKWPRGFRFPTAVVASLATFLVIGCAAGAVPVAHAGTDQQSAAGANETGDETVGDPYPLATCPVSDMELGSMGEPVVYAHEGREIRFCCPNCPEQFETDPEQYLSKIDRQLVEQQVARYPLETCVVSGRELGSMGEPVDLIHGNRLVRLCCPACEEGFEDDAEAHLQRLDEAVNEQQRDDYPLNTCLVSGRELGSMGEPVALVVAHRLVQLCCPMCEEDVHAEPAKYLEALEKAESVDANDADQD